jgi:hypothetical protein
MDSVKGKTFPPSRTDLGVHGGLVGLPLLGGLVRLLLRLEDVAVLLSLLGLYPDGQGICY